MLRQSRHDDGIIWLELTNGCNLTCSHCYSDSGPGTHSRDRLSTDDYLELIRDAAALGFKRVQFIGGEPLLNKDLPLFIDEAATHGFTAVELFSNLTFLPSAAKRAVVQHHVNVSTSIYSADSSVHDGIVGKKGSLACTLRNVEQLLACNVSVRAGFVEMERNAGHYAAVEELLRSRGLSRISHDAVRAFGRATKRGSDMSNLCGACAGNTACVSADGTVYPCVMGRCWPLGSVVTSALSQILASATAAGVRKQISRATQRRLPLQSNCGPQGVCGPTGYNPCGPQGNCGPSGKHCLPDNPTPNPHTALSAA